MNIVITVGSIALFTLFDEKFSDYSGITSVIIGILIYIYFPNTLDFSIVVLGTICINTLYTKKSFIFIILLVIISVVDGLANFTISSLLNETLAIGAGISISLLLSNEVRIMNMNNENQRGKTKKTEVERDLVQILCGILILLAIILTPKILLEGGLLLSVLLGIILIKITAVYGNSVISKTILHFERNDVQPGIGTLWFIAGLMILIALSLRWRVVEIGVFAMAIGDSLATIGGVNLKTRKLFFNPKKSLGGFISMLIPTAIFAFFVLGPIYIIIAIVATVIESLSMYPIDDNITIPVGVIVTNFLISLL